MSGSSAAADERRRVEVSRTFPVDASVAFAWVADTATHPRWIPLTRAEHEGAHEGGLPAVGQEFTMVSGPFALRGAPGFPDRMRVEECTPPQGVRPGTTRVRKLGPALLGDAGFEVWPLDAGRSRVVWWEDVHMAGPVPRTVTGPVVDALLRQMMRASLGRLGRLIRHGATP
ncbi:SRPBCC family protein [Oerskovia flava]|uniref:SRPBCC family protein n=1 Tax=Oerskovia flava TaxID=2986422 RepID=UPI00223F3278|nr:SRPBCC family protein [Oerskovia sp. JB1-3-2]